MTTHETKHNTTGLRAALLVTLIAGCSSTPAPNQPTQPAVAEVQPACQDGSAPPCAAAPAKPDRLCREGETQDCVPPDPSAEPGEAGPDPVTGEAAAPTDNQTRCEQASDYILVLMHQEMEKMFEGMPPEQADKARVEMEKELSRDLLVTECMKAKFTDTQFECVMRATSMNDLMQCEK